MSKWQTMETAPRDGSQVLVFTKGKKFDVLIWDCVHDKDYDNPFYSNWFSPGKHSVYGDDVPTHWTPKPKPPNIGV